MSVENKKELALDLRLLVLGIIVQSYLKLEIKLSVLLLSGLRMSKSRD